MPVIARGGAGREAPLGDAHGAVVELHRRDCAGSCHGDLTVKGSDHAGRLELAISLALESRVPAPAVVLATHLEIALGIGTDAPAQPEATSTMAHESRTASDGMVKRL